MVYAGILCRWECIALCVCLHCISHCVQVCYRTSDSKIAITFLSPITFRTVVFGSKKSHQAQTALSQFSLKWLSEVHVAMTNSYISGEVPRVNPTP